ncbi:hypothetical protein CVT24_006663 [Panaeolus cyanescens]|uniref:Uncharacterized protein n=1 Tax=Panaeolus cyanescens TaxID=181874 RepID=A0A409YSD4_9AGAR|nr:hypothetical protein CVT24_006663 [Panaeolus cyanescens]
MQELSTSKWADVVTIAADNTQCPDVYQRVAGLFRFEEQLPPEDEETGDSVQSESSAVTIWFSEAPTVSFPPAEGEEPAAMDVEPPAPVQESTTDPNTAAASSKKKKDVEVGSPIAGQVMVASAPWSKSRKAVDTELISDWPGTPAVCKAYPAGERSTDKTEVHACSFRRKYLFAVR